ncbi:MAG: DUF1315 family protein [Gammaproteobacteria bacterium]|nr:DUF1315 family protein [Gammaproteobacteria bacterium]NNJ72152.1 DUF1315 family protein [Enterobacterales bacterium]
MATNHTPSDINHLLAEMSQEVRDKLAEAVELGKWADGTKLSKEQIEQSLRAVMLWDSHYGQEQDEPFKVLRGGRLIDRAEKPKAKKTELKATDINIKLQ